MKILHSQGMWQLRLAVFITKFHECFLSSPVPFVKAIDNPVFFVVCPHIMQDIRL